MPYTAEQDSAFNDPRLSAPTIQPQHLVKSRNVIYGGCSSTQTALEMHTSLTNVVYPYNRRQMHQQMQVDLSLNIVQAFIQQ